MNAQAYHARTLSPQYRWRIITAGGLTLAAVHALLLRRLHLDEYTPDLYSVFALYIGLFASRVGRYTPCLALGLIRDFFSLGLLGSYGVLYSLLHKAAERARGKLDPEKSVNVLLLAFLGTFLVNFGYHGMLVVAGEGIGWSRAVVRCACVGASSAPLAVFLYPVFHAILHRMGVQRVGGYWNF